MMPGGSPEAYAYIKDIVEKVSAQVGLARVGSFPGCDVGVGRAVRAAQEGQGGTQGFLSSKASGREGGR